jgi:hypothetical protein
MDIEEQSSTSLRLMNQTSQSVNQSINHGQQHPCLWSKPSFEYRMQLPEGRTCPTISRSLEGQEVHLLQVPSVVHLEVARIPEMHPSIPSHPIKRGSVRALSPVRPLRLAARLSTDVTCSNNNSSALLLNLDRNTGRFNRVGLLKLLLAILHM